MPSAVQIALLVAGYALAIARLLNAGRLLWAWAPKWLQVTLPVLVVALPQLASGLGLVKTPMDLAVTIVSAVGAFAAAIRGTHPDAPSPVTARRVSFGKYLASTGCLCLLALMLGGCSLFGSSGSVWPTVAKCAPSPQNVINSVTQVLLGGGDYEAALEQLGEQYGMNVVVCVVDDLVKQWGSPTAKLTAETVEAKGRGQTFLAHVGTKVER